MIVAVALAVFLADPVVIAAGSGVDVSPPDSVSTMVVRNPAVSAGHELVVAWYATDAHQKMCVFAKQGTRAAVQIACGTVSTAPIVAAGGGGALVVYGLGKELVGVRLVGGKAKGKPVRIANAMTIGLAVGWDGTRFWLAYGDGKDAFVQRVSAAGALVGRPEVLHGESPRSGNLHVLCTAACELLTQGASRSLAGNKVGTSVPAGTDVLWKLTMPGFAAHPFFGVEKYRPMPAAADIVGAETPAGALVAWTRKDRPNVRGFELAFVPADPTHARHPPIAIATEYDPTVVALDETHFAIVASAYGPNGHLVTHMVTIDPAYFANAPAPRPLMAHGQITGANGKPASGAKIQFRVVFANGTQTTSSGLTAASDGSYQIPHPAPNDHDAGQDVVSIEVWANDGQDVSEVKSAAPAAPLDLVLRAAATVSLVLGNGKAVATVRLDHLDDISTLRDRRISWQKTVQVRDKLDLADVPAGRLEITARTDDGRGAFLATTIVPGKPTALTLPLGRMGSLVVAFDSKQPIEPVAVVQGEDTRDLNRERKRILELSDLPPGVHGIVFVSLPWQMTRRYTVKPRATDQVKLAFVADLPPGYVGMRISGGLTISGIAPGSPAELAGAYVGARIDKIDGTTPTSAEHATQLLRGAPGTKVKVEIANRTIVIERSRGTGESAPGGVPDLLAP